MQNERLYTVVESVSTGSDHTVTVSLNRQHRVYEGHFPQHPVLPGVCTLQIIKECLGVVVKKNIRYKTIQMCKFTSVIQPSDELIDISFSILDESLFSAIVSVKGKTVLKLKANFTEL